MKKLLVVCLTLILVSALSLTAFAVENNFVSSRSLEQAPVILTFKPIGTNTSNSTTNSTLKVVPYGSRDTLPAQLKSNIENAYNDITSNADITKLNSELIDIAKKNSLNPSNLAVSALFDAHTEDSSGAVVSKDEKCTVALSSKTANGFVALMKLNSNGTWETVKDAKLTNNKLTFTSKDSASYAIVVDNTKNDASDINESTVSIVEDNSAANSTLKIVSYKDRNTLPQDLKISMEKAYSEITENKDLTEIVPEIKDIAKGIKSGSKRVSVSNLFDIHAEDADGNVIVNGDNYSITISSDAAKNFVGLMKRNSDGKWEIVKDAKLDGNNLSFTFTGAAPYAILVYNTVSTTSPVTGDNSINFVLAITVLFTLAFAGVILSSKKQNG